jgi:AcrR family transcriptional regulator
MSRFVSGTEHATARNSVKTIRRGLCDEAIRLDRRSARTKRALRGALTSLLRTKTYDQITVQDILNEADVGRSTFYSHCRGKEDLLRRGLQPAAIDAHFQRFIAEGLGNRRFSPLPANARRN